MINVDENIKKNISIEKQIIQYVVRTAIVLVILILMSGDLNVLRGYLLGLIIGLLMFFRIVTVGKKSLKMSKERVVRYRRFQYLIRYVIYAAVLSVAFQREYLSFAGTVIGLLTMKIGIVIWGLRKVIIDTFKSLLKSK